ncbi:hypothetical protein ACSV5G_10735 [Agrobacterium cavarae]|uniref:hypothetical protein n=1 Tax=Agrobacterium cavarae TaxID=2528239 RepID=UPI003FD2514B
MPTARRIQEIIKTPFAIFLSALIDIIMATRESFVIGVLLFILYSLSLLTGIIIGETLNDLLEVPLMLISFAIPTPIDFLFDIASYLVLMWAGLAIAFFITRAALAGIMWTAYSLRLSGTIWWLNTICLLGLLLTFALAVIPASDFAAVLTLATGYVLLLAILSAISSLWVWNRYRLDRHSRRRNFDHETAGGWHHLSEHRDFSDLRTL